MSQRYRGGFITANPPAPTSSAAPGVWTITQQLQAKAAGNWPEQQFYWIGLLTGPASAGRAVAVDSAGNVYVAGQSLDAGIARYQIAKYNTSGVLQWQKRIGSGYLASSIAVDSSGNIFVYGGGADGLQLIKCDASGNILWQRALGGSSATNNGFPFRCAVDGSGNVYICGTYPTTGSFRGFQIAKYNTSGTIQWQRRLGGDTEDFYDEGYGIAVDTSGNVFVSGYTFVTQSSRDFQIAKYNTSGSIQWQRRLSSGSDETCYSIAVDSGGSVYVCGTSSASGTDDFQIAKYNTSGTIQWQRRLGGSGTSAGVSVAVTGPGDVYVCGYSNASGTFDFQIAKYNSSGTIQWQRSLGGSGSDSGYSIATDSSGNAYVCGAYNNGSAILFAKLPGSGALAGNYTVGGQSITYAASSLTDAATSLTDSASSLTDAATSRTDAATSLTDAASTLTSSVTTL